IRRRAAVPFFQEPAHVLDVPGRGEVRRRAARREDELLPERPLLLLGVDEAFLAHALKDVALAPERLLRVALRIVAARRLGQSGQERRLRDRQILDRRVEELSRRRRHAIGARTEVYL